MVGRARHCCHFEEGKAADCRVTGTEHHWPPLENHRLARSGPVSGALAPSPAHTRLCHRRLCNGLWFARAIRPTWFSLRLANSLSVYELEVGLKLQFNKSDPNILSHPRLPSEPVLAIYMSCLSIEIYLCGQDDVSVGYITHFHCFLHTDKILYGCLCWLFERQLDSVGVLIPVGPTLNCAVA